MAFFLGGLDGGKSSLANSGILQTIAGWILPRRKEEEKVDSGRRKGRGKREEVGEGGREG